MTTIRDRSGLSAEPSGRLVHLARDFYPLGLVASGAIRRTLREVLVAADPHRGRRPPPLAAPHREEGCPATSVHARSENFCS
jgi:hypothetical protein